jgi:PAS domain S-box-containing protein
MAERARASERDHVMLEEALGHAYEGILITDAEGMILKTNEAYARFLGVRMEDMIGRHVTEVVENTRMHIVARTGIPEIAQLQRIRGHEMICHRIPILERGKVVAVVGKVMFREVDDLFTMTTRFSAMKKELEFYKDELQRRGGVKHSFERIVGTSAPLERTKALARKVARTDTTVLLEGESGTGKELFAQAIHLESPRALGPFVKVNCAAIPETLFESELFGYKPGAFTGANRGGRKGKFALAEKGTILLDEVSELPLSMQVKLLRVLQEREIEPVGAVEPEPIDVRVLAATNKDLDVLVAQGAFRKDLFYRLNVLKLEIPALRARADDIPLLVESLLRGLERETGIPVDGLVPEAERRVRAYPWPGNVRELRNALEQALYVKAGRSIQPEDLPPAVAGERSGDVDGEPHALKDLLRRTEAEAIQRALREARGDKRAAAAQLGISKSSLYAKLEQYGIARTDEASGSDGPASWNPGQESGNRRPS